jgi:transposase
VERSRWLFLWLLARGFTDRIIAGITGYSAYWIGRIARRYNEQGPDGVKDQRHQARPGRALLAAAQQDELLAAIGGDVYRGIRSRDVGSARARDQSPVQGYCWLRCCTMLIG